MRVTQCDRCKKILTQKKFFHIILMLMMEKVFGIKAFYREIFVFLVIKILKNFYAKKQIKNFIKNQKENNYV